MAAQPYPGFPKPRWTEKVKCLQIPNIWYQTTLDDYKIPEQLFQIYI